MTWIAILQLLGPGLIALAGAWRSHSLTKRENAALRAEMEELRSDHAECTRNVEALRDELIGKRRDENAGGGSLMHRPTQDEPVTRKQRKP